MFSVFELASLLLFLSATFGFLNRSLLHLPNSVGLLLLGLLASILLVSLQFVFPNIQLYDQLEASLRQLDFAQIVFNGMLAFLLFAGALNVNFNELRKRAGAVLYLAIVGTIISTAVIGTLFFLAAGALGIALPFSWALVFGALISPTDPVAVLSILKGVAIPHSLRVEAEGEALFNDGVGVVLFSVLLAFAIGGEEISIGAASLELLREAGGGALVGLATGYVAYRAMRAIDDFPIEVLITLALVSGTYALSQRIGVSGPIATVAAGLLVGYRAPKDAMSDQTQRYVSALWTLVDEVLNAMLFLLIGLEVLVLNPSPANLAIGALSIPIALAGRLVAVGLPLVLPRPAGLSPSRIPFLTWAGVRGGISVALALALPDTPAKPILVAATYAVVLFSILVQGTTLPALTRRLGLATA